VVHTQVDVKLLNPGLIGIFFQSNDVLTSLTVHSSESAMTITLIS